MSRASPFARLLRRWHKRLGLAAAVFFAFLALSGLALNHGDVLKLDATKVAAPWLMAWYGLKPTLPEQGFALEGEFFCWQGDIWTLGGRPLKPGRGEPVGAVRLAGQTWVATAETIHLYDDAGRQVDKIEREFLPGAPIRRLGVRDQRLVAAIGSAIYASADGLAWERLPGEAAVGWSRPSPLPLARQHELAPLFAPALPLQRILADLHSGRIFGRYGVLATDALAVALMILAASGAWLYWKEHRSRRRARTAAPP